MGSDASFAPNYMTPTRCSTDTTTSHQHVQRQLARLVLQAAQQEPSWTGDSGQGRASHDAIFLFGVLSLFWEEYSVRQWQTLDFQDQLKASSLRGGWNSSPKLRTMLPRQLVLLAESPSGR
ncbi:hypothetical protein LMH87_006225 [Akanthomyces muscarius]|uniref:Uncharacterized protein n=1 Tax=Akanthomyces muscarius TaxID=2231603 RepID=A0A9W8QP55_AKAMU|nr:hypothetical protein LMH87_006225 [Akanthomyces muscarius]KAJ4164555.1 hypothetical protein LMH87_006225 [Akanthomyces muscarius]